MKVFLIYYEPFNERLALAETALIAAENEAKAKQYFKAVYEGRILKVQPLKQV